MIDYSAQTLPNPISHLSIGNEVSNNLLSFVYLLSLLLKKGAASVAFGYAKNIF
jgi:hypothetical protein